MDALRSAVDWFRAILLVLLIGLWSDSSPAQQPPSGSLNPASTPLTWVGTSPGGTSLSGEASCQEGTTCETFVLTLSGQPADWFNKVVRVELHWLSPSSDYDFYVHKGSPNGPIVARGGEGLTNFELDEIDPATDGTGDFYVHVVYFAATSADQYNGKASVIAQPTPPPLAAVGSGIPPRYQSHTPTAAQIAAGISRNSQDEPNIGVNWNTGKIMIQALLQTLRVTFNDLICPTTPESSWEDRTPVTSSATTLDPILFTDRVTGRTLVSQLLFNPLVSASSFTDTDGETWTPSQGAGITSGVDHQTIGGGPFHAPLTTGVGYAHAVYYCAQNIADANCALSLDGGLTYGPAVVIYHLGQCGGLHGHIKVGGDGTAYVPNSNCIGQVNPTEQAVVVSEDNGLTWTVRTVRESIGGTGSDPSVAIDEGGRVYLGYTSDDRSPAVVVSDDHGRTWQNMFDVGTPFGIKNAVFPAMVAGDPGRAAMAFYGTKEEGLFTELGFLGVWHLYVAHTYDGGKTWVTVNATPNDAIQQGALWLGGGGNIQRNLLDFFDATLDSEGRVVIGYADGCHGMCSQASLAARGNSYTAYSTIARQSGGRRLIAQFDPPEPTIPGAPRLTVTRNGSVTRLTWSQSDGGASPISKWKVFRAAAGQPEQLLAEVTSPEYTDQSGNPTITYSYRVVAVNGLGESCGTNAVTAVPAGSSCIAPGIKVVADPTGDVRGAPLNADLDIESISLGEPFFAAGVNKLVFTMKVASLANIPPSRMWRIIWNYPDAPPGEPSFEGRYYVGMNSSATGAISFEYGFLVNEAPVLINTFTPISLGAPDPESKFAADGTITLVLSTDKIGNPKAGDLVGGLIGRTFPVRENATLRSEAAADTVAFADTYALVGNAFCQNPPPTVNCLEDTDPRIAYSNGWHLVSSTNASAGHFRYNTGKDASHGLSLAFEVPGGASGGIVFHYAKTAKGGTADVYVDGIFRETISFAGGSGVTRDPQFGFSARYGGLTTGTHAFELRNLRGPAYVDRLCLESAFSSAQPASGPGQTSSSTKTLGVAEELLQSLTVPTGVQALSVVTEVSAAVPVRLVLIDPAGAVLQVADAVAGIAVVEGPVAQSGAYVIKVVNVGVGAVEVWTLATPLVARQ